jgi:hypothetical protein
MRRLGTALLACCTTVGAAVQAALGTPALAPEIDLTATALIMGGTNEVLSVGPSTPEFIAEHLAHINRDFIAPTGLCVGGDPGCALVAVYTPSQLRPFTGFLDMTLDDSVAAGRENLGACIRGDACTVTPAPYTSTGVQALGDTAYVVTGSSQSAAVASLEKSDLIADPIAGSTISFVLISNPNRPNGGLLQRLAGAYIPIVGISFNGSTPTDSPRSAPLTTVDVTRQYDLWSDFPTNPLNLLAVLNAFMGGLFLHDHYLDVDSPAVLQGHYQDSAYYLEPTNLVPLLGPLAAIPVVGMPIAQLLDAPLRVLVETGYDRTINPGQPTPAKILYFPNPIKTAIDFAISIPTGWDDAISYVSGDPLNRPFRTAPQPVYGVGGPPVYAGAIDPYGQTPPLPTPAAAVPSPKESLSQTVSARSGPEPAAVTAPPVAPQRRSPNLVRADAIKTISTDRVAHPRREAGAVRPAGSARVGAARQRS